MQMCFKRVVDKKYQDQGLYCHSSSESDLKMLSAIQADRHRRPSPPPQKNHNEKITKRCQRWKRKGTPPPPNPFFPPKGGTGFVFEKKKKKK